MTQGLCEHLEGAYYILFKMLFESSLATFLRAAKPPHFESNILAFKSWRGKVKLALCLGRFIVFRAGIVCDWELPLHKIETKRIKVSKIISDPQDRRSLDEGKVEVIEGMQPRGIGVCLRRLALFGR